MGPKPVVFSICLSLGLHAALGWSLARDGFLHRKDRSEAIEISFPEAPKKPAAPPVKSVEAAKPKEAAPAPKKKIKGIPVPKYWPKETPPPLKEEAPPVKEGIPSEFRKALEENLKNQEKMLARLSAEQTQKKAPKKDRPKTSAEMLADPQKGSIFVGYLSEVRIKIQQTLSDRYAHLYAGRGSVELVFVLQPKGAVEKVLVMPRGTAADDRLQDLAVQCLREAAPFGPFPKELGTDRIVFNITVLFEGK
jgi:outer membrane biosynthesis protein TonB